MAAQDLIYFGDSLTDNGNLAAALDAALGPGASAAQVSIGPQGAITNAFPHTTYTEALTGAGIENFAVSGALAAGEQLVGDVFDINLGAQVDRFVANLGERDVSDARVVFFIGLNDFNAAFTEAVGSGETDRSVLSGIVADTGAAIQGAIAEAVQTVASVGITDISFMALPLTRFFPSFDGLPGALVTGTDILLWGYNRSLEDLAGQLGA